MKLSKQRLYFPLRTAHSLDHMEPHWGSQPLQDATPSSLTRKHESDYLARSKSLLEKLFTVACSILAGGRGHSFSLIFIYRFI